MSAVIFPPLSLRFMSHATHRQTRTTISGTITGCIDGESCSVPKSAAIITKIKECFEQQTFSSWKVT